MIDEVLTQIVIAKQIWDIPYRHERKAAILAYLNKSYPGWTPVKAERPFVLCRDDRKKRKG